MALDDRVLAIIANGVEVKIEGLPWKQRIAGHQVMPGGEHVQDLGMVDTR